jgi:putative oxygen-independent coproporphyrinogen III oxidase
MIMAMAAEIHIRKDYLGEAEINTIYFGGGTPSFVKKELISILIDAIAKDFKIAKDPEITLEANPEDLNHEYPGELLETGINRLSLGIQSFCDDDLKFMNRVHDAAQAKRSIEEARNAGFKNINIDLIYGFQGLTDHKWRSNIDKAIGFHVEHLSAYHLTYEPTTVLYYRKLKNRISEIEENNSLNQFSELSDRMKAAEYIHYEISNFALDGFFSRHNAGYWQQIPYLGIGPSAHSYNGKTRQWNIAKNMSYIKNIKANKDFFVTEELDTTSRYHDYVMTTLRAMWGTDVRYILYEFGPEFQVHFIKYAAGFIKSGDIVQKNDTYCLTDKGMLISDFIIKKLFI